MSNIAEKKNLKRNKIIEAASKLFLDKSFASTAVDDVVRMAGVAKGTFYLYFKDKYDLLDQIVSFQSAEVLKNGIALLAEKEKTAEMTLIERSNFLTDYVVDYLFEHKDLAALLNKKLSSCFRNLSSGEGGDFTPLIDTLAEDLVEKGLSKASAKMKIYLVIDLIGSVCCDSVLGKGPYSLEQIRPELKKAVAGILGGDCVD